LGVPEQYRHLISADGAVANFESMGWAELPGWVAGLDGLETLNLNDNQLTGLPDWVGGLTSLTDLSVMSNRLASVPECLGRLTRLTSLQLSDNQLKHLPGFLRNLNALTGLWVWRNQLSILPDWLAEFPGLTHLWVQDNPYTQAPDWIRTLSKLKGLGLNINRFDDPPQWIGGLTSLAALGLTGSELTRLPDWVSDLAGLRQIFLGNNQLTDLPEWIGSLTGLYDVSLSGNQLTRLPEPLAGLAGLKELSAGFNRITEIPGWIGSLANLRRLDLSRNQLRGLPWQLADLLDAGLDLSVGGNPLHEPVPELAARGSGELATYLRSLKDAVPQYEAKLLLVGEGNVGKSSLVAALKGDPFVSGRPTTHGIKVTPVPFRHPDLDADMTLRAWDFGGQEVYRVSHQFFLSPRAVYLVAWHARHGQERDQVEDWLRRIRLRTGDEAVALVVATHCAERRPDLDYAHLDRVFPGMLAGAFETDSSSGEGIARLRDAIAGQAARLPQMGQLVSPLWRAAREEVLALAVTEPQVTYEKFTEISERNGLTGLEAATLARLMHDLGLVIYYDADDGLRDVVVLNPEWLTRAISFVLDDRDTANAGGILDHTRLRAIWQDREDGYPARYHPYFLRLMEKFDISYRIDGDETYSLVPQLVPYQRPALPWEPGSAPPAGTRSLSLTCRLSEPAPGLIPWLTARHHRASTGRHWRRGVFLRHPVSAYRSEALVELRRDDELFLEVRAPSPDLYFNVLRDSVEDLITRRWPGLGYRLYIPCPQAAPGGHPCPGRFPLDGLLKIRETGHTATVSCYDCGEQSDIAALLTGFTFPAGPLAAVIEEVHGQVAGIADAVSGLRGQAAEIADIANAVRRIHQVVSVEVTDCPRLFTLEARHPDLADRARPYLNHYRLTLWCEHPGCEHPWDPASYDLDPPKEWLARIAPYARLVFKTLQVIVPVAAAIDIAALPTVQQGDTQARLAVMQAVIAGLPSATPASALPVPADEDSGPGKLTPPEGQALRAVRQIVFESDPLHSFGDMRRVQSPAGDLLWVCPVHHKDYDPGLPALP
jgi:internalin A